MNHPRHSIRVIAAWLVSLSACVSLFAEDKPEPSPAVAEAREHVSELKVSSTRTREAPIELLPNPLLTYGDAARNNEAGTLWAWGKSGRDRFPKSQCLMIEADAGGRNGCRPRLWKRTLQEFADETGWEITVCHYPTGASKWNPIEHRVFGPITINWSGEPLTSLKAMLSLIRGTTTATGLTITATQSTKTYPIHIKVSNAEFNALNLHRHEVCPRWNYTIKPRSAKNTE